MEQGNFSREELPRVVDRLFEESDVIAHQALSRILQLIREESDDRTDE